MQFTDDPIPSVQGLAALARLVYEGGDAPGLGAALAARLDADASDAGAMMDLACLVQLAGQRENGLQLQAGALELSRAYVTRHGDGSGLRVLALMVPGDMMANTPLDFLLVGSDAQLCCLYLDADGTLPARIPDHDVAVLAVGESAENARILRSLQPMIRCWPRPMLNANPDQIARLTRDGVSALFVDEPSILCPPTRRMGRAALADTSAELDYPLIVRPVGSHAGVALERIADAGEMYRYLASRPEAELYVSPFVDYRSPDGLYRKQRIVFIDGAPFVAHMAISDHWMVHYLSAGMHERAERRAEEADFMAGFDTGFRRRHAPALSALNDRLQLDYFGIDCAETPDGRLLLFEADVAMIVHDLDDEATFPYKKPAMRRLFAALQDLLAKTAATPGLAVGSAA